MNHSDVKKSLADYLEGDLSLEDRAMVDAHLDQCVDCALEVDEMEQTIRLLRTMPEPEVPPMMAANVMRRIRAGEAEPGFFTRLGRGIASIFEPSFMLPASAVAAAALVVVVLQDPGVVGMPGAAGPSPSSLAADTSSGLKSATARLENVPRWTASAESARAPRPAMATLSPLDSLGSRRARSTSVTPVRSGSPGASGSSVLAAAAPPSLPLSAAPRDGTLGGQGALNRQLAPSVVVDRVIVRTAPGQPRTGAGFAGGAIPVAGAISPQMLESLRSTRATPFLAGNVSGSTSDAISGADQGSGDPRDAWLALAFERPADFARFLVDKNLAEQELWVARLSERAEARGLLDELIDALIATEDVAAGVLAEDFLAVQRDGQDRGENGAAMTAETER